MDLQRGPHGRFHIVALWLGGVENLHGECPTGHLEQWCIVEIFLKLLGIQGSRHDHHLELASLAILGPLRQNLHQ